MKYFVNIIDYKNYYYGEHIKTIEFKVSKKQQKFIESSQGQLYFYNKYGSYPYKMNVEMVKITKDDIKEIKTAIKKDVKKERFAIKKRLIENLIKEI